MNTFSEHSMLVVCMLSHGNLLETQRAVDSVNRFGLEVVVGLTREGAMAPGGARVVPIPWEDDFAQARNLLLGHVSSRFVLWLDSDETLVAFPKLNLDGLDGQIFAVSLQYSSESIRYFSRRLHRNSPAVSWKGRIHEQLAAARLNQGEITIPSIHIQHLGYEDKEVMAAKHLRNLRIALPGLDGGNPTYWELLTLARAETAIGRFNLILWVRCFLHPEHEDGAFYDRRWESAIMLCSAGYIRPALRVLDRGALSVPVQLAVLAAQKAMGLPFDKDRFQFVHSLLENGTFDFNHPFPKVLLGISITGLESYIENEAKKFRRICGPIVKTWPDLAMNSKSFLQSTHVETTAFENDLLVMNIETRQVVLLNEVAAGIWEALGSRQTFEELHSILTEAFPSAVPAELGSHLTSVLQTLEAAELIQIRSD